MAKNTAVPAIRPIGSKTRNRGRGDKNTNGVPQLDYKKVGGDLKYDSVTGEQITLDKFTPTDTTFNYKDVTPGSVTADELHNQFMTSADYTMVDPAEISKKFGDIARGQARENLGDICRYR